jgi:uncharacterized membrane protein
MMKAMNLILGLFWVIIALALFIQPLINPQAGRLTLGNTGISFAWIALFFAGYNLIRWWSIRVNRRDREVMEQRLGRSRRLPEKRHPEFDFSEEENQSEPEA